MALGRRELAEGLAELIARICLVEPPKKLPRTESQFAALLEESVEAISIATQDIAKWLPKLADKVHAARLAMEKLPDKFIESRQDLDSQIQLLLHQKFLLETPWRWLEHFPRYFDAILIRCEKLAGGYVDKDVETMRHIEPHLAALTQSESNHEALSVFDPELETYRWMIEELRVSLFAQKLGTCMTVSEKRMAKQFSKVQSL